MDNLQLFYSFISKIDKNACGMIKSCSGIDSNGICLITENNILYVQNGNDPRRSFKIKEVQKDLKYIEYLPVHKAIFLSSATEMAIFDLALEDTRLIYTMDNEILDLAWNSTQTIMVLIDTQYVVHSYSYADLRLEGSYSLIQRFKISLASAVPESIVVGWGSQNTQFQGPKTRRQKDLKENKEEERVYNGPPKISWRGNGEQFVVNYYKDNGRYLKVFDSQLSPLFESSNAYHNLTEPVSFMGQGQYIATCFVEKDTNSLVIFEKNCKMKSTTILKDTPNQILQLLFHPRMNILGVLSRDEQLNSFVDIYIYSNGCWFLKQKLSYISDEIVHEFFWIDYNIALYTIVKMVIITNKEVQYLSFKFVVNNTAYPAITGVINGTELNIYEFDNYIIPPPMSLCVFKHERPINRIIFHPHKPLCVLIDSSFQFSVLSIENASAKTLFSTKDFDFKGRPDLLEVNWDNGVEIILQVEDGSAETPFLELKNENTCLKILGRSKVLLDSFELDYTVSNGVLDISKVYLYHSRTAHVKDSKTLIFDVALNACMELCVNNDVVCSGVTSVVHYKEYLLWTTANGTLHCVRIYQLEKFKSVENIYKRPTENGARIVCCQNSIPPQIILQLPRGNLETIDCKMILIDMIDNMLSKNEWGDALEIMRAKRINWNVLIDLNPERFCNHIEDFIKAAKHCSVLTTIVTDFNMEQNIFSSLYKNCYFDAINNENAKKRETVKKILNYLCKKNYVNNLSSIVAIQQKHLSLKEALISVKQVYQADTVKNEKLCSKIIKQILQQAHMKDVLRAAFGLFDLRLLELIYRNSNEDPKVFKPEIANLQNMCELERRFQLSVKAYNHSEAIKYMLLCKKFDEEHVKTFIAKNKLEYAAYSGMKKFKDVEPQQFQFVSSLYAKRLTFEGKYTEAGMVFKQAGLLKESLEAYQRALQWSEVMVLMNVLKYNEVQKMEVLEKLTSELLSKNQLEDAVILLEYHIKDYKRTVEALCDYKSFRRAILKAKIYGETELLDSYVLPGLMNYYKILSERIDSLHNTFNGYVKRLEEVRRKKLERNDEDVYQPGEHDDLFSETSSISSRSSRTRASTSSSRKSTLSSKNRRKEEKKKVDLREGGYYEDIALMRVLHMMYDEVHEFSKGIRDICLIEELDENDYSKILHEKLGKLCTTMKEKIKDIWPETFYKTPTEITPEIRAIIQNKNDLDPKYTIPPSTDLLNDSWKLALFP